ncbi:hypothetical protein HKX48_001053 [Thoreauomyces humboldtii]|nr:hypothetical protein HKX48_001053 [Thoreauomyces humboldtii]
MKGAFHLLGFYLLVAVIWPSAVLANTEKIIFSPHELATAPVDVYLSSHVSPSSTMKHLSAATPTLLAEHIIPGESKYYRVSLPSEASHEIRICWPATSPADWQLDLVRRETGRESTDGSRSKTLDGGEQRFLRVSARHAGVGFDHGEGKGVHEGEVPYAIALDRLILGGIPASSLPHVEMVLGIVGLISFTVLPLFSKLLDASDAADTAISRVKKRK